jgi:muramidase (phage lysozyme)
MLSKPDSTHSRARRPGPRRLSAPRKSIGALALVLVGLVATTGCLPGVALEQWVPDGDGNGQISAAEVESHRSTLTQLAGAVEAARRDIQRHPFLACVRHHESDSSGPHPYIRGYTAQNRRSTASGAYQFLDSTWRGASQRAGYPGYARAKQAPWWVQDAVALHVFKTGGRSAWNGSGC